MGCHLGLDAGPQLASDLVAALAHAEDDDGRRAGPRHGEKGGDVVTGVEAKARWEGVVEVSNAAASAVRQARRPRKQ